MPLNFDPLKTGLPVTEVLAKVRTNLSADNTLILSARPGAGKSTVLPLALLGEPWLEGKKIIMLEPRRLAASTVAHRMASMLGEAVGKTVGYRIRFENKVSAATRIEVVTEGILTRMLQNDNALDDAGLVIFDEIHERSIHADIALALCREVQQILRPDLRMLLMSATLDMQGLSGLLNAPVVESSGRTYPVDIIYTGEQDIARLADLCCKAILRAWREQEGDILVFLPGQNEIRKCEELLRRQSLSASVHPLYGQLPHREQQLAILPHPEGTRKIVLSTSIAETSLTIEGVKVVVDSGYIRTPAFDAKTGLTSLKTSQVSLDSAGQRAGRAGRLSKGVCYRMWSKATEEKMAAYRSPEILEADLVPLVLDMANWGIKDLDSLTWLTPPPTGSLTRAREILHQLNALADGRITAHGRQIHSLPCHPRIAHMLILAEGNHSIELATDLAALLEERDPMAQSFSIDINLRIEALRRYRVRAERDRRFENIERIAAAYRRLFNCEESNETVDPYATGRLLAYAYPERIAAKRPGQTGQYQLANGKMAAVDQNDELSAEAWLAVAQIDARTGIGKVFMAAPLSPADLLELARESETVMWDTRKGGLIATRDLRIGSLVLKSAPVLSPPEELVAEVVSEAIKKEGKALLSFTEEVEQLQNRLACLKIWNPEQGWPDRSTDRILADNKEWLWPYLPKVRKLEDLKAIKLQEVLQQSLDYQMQQQLEKLAPSHIRVPSGSMIKLSYQATGEAPVLAVRLQEVFGMLDTPRVNGGKTGVVLHLLSPGFKPVQVTSDLRSFWENAYFEVRKELKRRYPRHSWPEEPLDAEAVRGVKRRPA